MASLFTWDWKEQPPMDEIAKAVSSLTEHQYPVYLTPTGADDTYAVVVSDIKLTPEQARQLFDTPDAVVKVEVAIEYPTGNQVDIIDIPLAELIGLEGPAREAQIIEAAGDYVNNVCSWGAAEVGTADYPDEET